MNRIRHSALPNDQRIKANVRSYANTYVKRGVLIKKPCEKCGEPKAQMHHEDYSKPLEVVWLCRPCHMQTHKNEKRTSE